MSVNELRSPMIRPGQKLHLPAGSQAGGAPSGAVAATTEKRIVPARGIGSARPAAISAARPIAPTTGDWSGSYTIQPGDSLYMIAARYHIKYRDLQRANRIVDVRKIRPGTVIKVPGEGGSSAADTRTAAVSPEPTRPAGPTPMRISVKPTEPVAPPSSVSGVKVLNADQPPKPVTAVERREEKVAAAPRIAPSAAPAAQSHAAKLRWPVKGRIVQGFGPRVDGGHNDGVDVSVPMGTDVLAAEDGVVAYAGGEVKTYGNLVLVRHQNGLVTAYAYNDKILVQRGDRVKRGQPIAKAGKTGSTDRPQLHFEVRVGAKPVDPVPYLERM
jgi:murein DD-endopeptidase MepM/ murein hydrolase activator NlpD